MRFAGAIADYTQAIALDPKYAPAYYNRGLAWEKKNDLPEALADFEKFAEVDPSNPAGPTALARVTKTLGR
jgi:tetratricopeptide (TPR) repeat protein